MEREQQWLLQEKYHGVTSSDFYTDCERLINGTPLAYLIGHIPFLDCTIWLDSQPLIPRPETEYWTQLVIDQLQHRDHDEKRVLDLCAGSGCIGVAVAKHIPKNHVDFAEIALTHRETIVKNCQRNKIDLQKTIIYTSDLFSKLSEQYDYILTNPPYIDASLKRVAPTVTAHEPSEALYGGTDGLDIIRRIILDAPQHLHPNGQLWIEHEPEQVTAITKLAHDQGFSTQTHTDQYNINRFSILTMAQ